MFLNYVRQKRNSESFGHYNELHSPNDLAANLTPENGYNQAAAWDKPTSINDVKEAFRSLAGG
jgi:hypothetical protein